MHLPSPLRSTPGRLMAVLIAAAALLAARYRPGRLDRAAAVQPVASPGPARGAPDPKDPARTAIPAPATAPGAPRVLAAAAPRPRPAPDTSTSLSAAGPVETRRLRRGVTPAAWPAGPAPLPGAVLPARRIVAFYGNPLSRRMGILGELPRDSMLDSLRRTAAAWAAADSTTPVQPALHLIVSVAQGWPGRDGKHRLRMPDSLVQQVAGWAEANHWLLFLDVQVGWSTVEAELPRLAPYLARPYVHLALDPEFAMKDRSIPGRKIGTMDAAEVNYAIRLLGGLVDSLHLPPKVLVVHRFTQRMLTGYDRIELDPRVQVVIHMDGFGSRGLKRSVYRDFIVREPVQFTGFKLFLKNDAPLMTPDEVLSLSPVPVYIQYQ